MSPGKSRSVSFITFAPDMAIWGVWASEIHEGYRDSCRDWERMLTFYRYPKEHWVHIRTTNVVESPFAALRLRTDAAKRFKKVERATAVILPGHRGGTVRLPGLRGGDGADPPPRRTGEPKTR